MSITKPRVERRKAVAIPLTQLRNIQQKENAAGAANSNASGAVMNCHKVFWEHISKETKKVIKSGEEDFRSRYNAENRVAELLDHNFIYGQSPYKVRAWVKYMEA